MKDITNTELMKELEKRLLLSEATIHEQNEMLSKMRELNKKLEQSEAMKSHFLSNIKNEINNPLASILALSQNLLSKQNMEESTTIKALRLINNEAHVLDYQLANIFTAAEIEAGQINLQVVNTNISQVIQRVIDSFAVIIEKRKLIVVVSNSEESAGEDVHFVTDRNYFKIIITNLISNALKFSSEKGDIKIEINSAADDISIRVSDSGNGIKGEDFDKIFDRFTQLDFGTVKKYQGHGLGLSIVKSLVELLGGNVEVVSSDKGSTFTVSLPKRSVEDGISTASEDGTDILFDQTF